MVLEQISLEKNRGKELTDAQLAIKAQIELYRLLGLDAKERQGDLMKFINENSKKIRKTIDENPEIINLMKDEKSKKAAEMLKKN